MPPSMNVGRANIRVDLKDSAVRAHEQELKRVRGAISCAECRRLKLKCDKTIPCSSCKRRGCASICPTGSLTTGQGTRFVLADTERLHKKIAAMSDRIRQLEDALAIQCASAGGSSGPHPLLRRDLLKVKSGLDLHYGGLVGLAEQNQEEWEDAEEEYIDAFGTLAVRDDGAAMFYGRSAGSESLLADHSIDDAASPASSTPALPPALARLNTAFPLGPSEFASNLTEQTLVERYLPPWERAHRLSELYLAQECWHYGAVTRRQLLEELLPGFYPESVGGTSLSTNSDSSPNPNPTSSPSAHDLALLYIILSFGALTDPSSPTSPEDEAELYYALAKASLNLEPVLEHPPSVATVQALSLMGIYVGMRAGENSIESTWALMGLAGKLAQSIGLHRDSARWNLSPFEVQKRRALFWELFITDCWQSLATGRLPTFSLPYVDCELPQDVEQTMAEDGTVLPSFPYWKARFGRECVSAIVQGTLTSRAPKYGTIIELDRKIREMELPKYAQGPAPTGDGVGLAETMRHFMPIIYHNLTLLYVHRVFFAQALNQFPTDPLRSQYAPSFLAGYRSACELVTVLREAFGALPKEIARFWVLWTHGFSSSVMLASVVTHAPRAKVAKAALMELSLAHDLYERAAPYGGRSAKFLPIIKRLHTKAKQVFADGWKDPPADIFTTSRPKQNRDELAVFSGRTHTVAMKNPNPRVWRTPNSSQPQSQLPTPSQDSPSDIGATADSSLSPHTSSHGTPPMSAESYTNVHPWLVDQLHGFEGQLNAQIRSQEAQAYYNEMTVKAWQEQVPTQPPNVPVNAVPEPEPSPIEPHRMEPSYGTYEPVREEQYSHTYDQYQYGCEQSAAPVGYHYFPSQPAVPASFAPYPQAWHEPHGHETDLHLDARYPAPESYHQAHPTVPSQMDYATTPMGVTQGVPLDQGYSLQETWSTFMHEWGLPGGGAPVR